MSVDISRLSASLPPEQQKAVERAYRQRAKNPTTAFLLCFFLGIFGAHCFYLGKTGQGVFRLIISPLIIPGLIWEVVDLFRIDGEVYERNLKLGEQLVAEAMLAVPPVAAEQEAIRRLDEVIQEQEQGRAQAAAVAAPAAEALAVPTAPEAVHAADSATVTTPAAATSDTAGAPAAPEMPVWPVEAAAAAGAAEAATAFAAAQAGAGEQQPAAAEERPTARWAAQPADAMAAEPVGWGQSRGADAGEGAGSAAAWSASQTSGSGDEESGEAAYPWPEARPLSPEPSESGPLWAKPPALMAGAGLATAAALGAADVGPASAESAPPQVASFESAWPEQASPAPAWQVSSDADAGYQQPGQPDVFAAEAAPGAFATEPGPDDTWAVITPEAVAAAALMANQAAPVRRAPGFDVTDQSVDDSDPGYVADIGEGGPAGRVHVSIPLSQPLPGSYAFGAAPAQDLVAEEYVAAPSATNEPQPVPPGAQGVGDVPTATLLLVPLAEAAAEPAGAEPQTQAATPVGDYESHVTEEVHDQGSQGGRRVVKRVRVVRRLMVNGQVVQETSAEQVVDADTDPAATAASLQQALGSTDPETLARLAGTLPENYVVRQADQSEGSAGPGSTGSTGQTGQAGS